MAFTAFPTPASLLLLQFEIANFELFSNLPRDVGVWGSQRYPSRDWTPLGTFIAQEGARGVQPFLLSTDTFFKYIKVRANTSKSGK